MTLASLIVLYFPFSATVPIACVFACNVDAKKEKLKYQSNPNSLAAFL